MNKKRILVIDDEAGFTRMLRLNLEATQRYEVRVVNWPEDALGAGREFEPDLVLLDVFMPRLSGGDIAAQFKNDARLKHVPVIFFTAAVQRSRVHEHDGLISGVPFIAKPASFDEVMASIEKYLPDEKQPS